MSTESFEERQTRLREERKQLVEKMEKEGKVECDTCRGRGEVMYSCCTGEVVDDDIAMCPKCHEHLGDEECQDCDGTGFVAEDKTDFAHKIPGLQQQAEALMDARKYGDI